MIRRTSSSKSLSRLQCWACLLAGLAAAALMVVSSADRADAKEGSGEKGSQTKSDQAPVRYIALPSPQPMPMFNGKNLDGWVKRGGEATYTIEGDAIVGTSRLNTPNTFLCTPVTYSDFILDVDLKVDDGLNSGIQIRSNAFPEERVVEFIDEEGKAAKKKIPANRVHGYQVEIDTTDRAWSAGIYDEARRGWLNNLEKNEAARKAFKNNDWNHYKIVAVGNKIKTWINGVPAANLKDDMTAEGFIALQVHNIPSKDLEGKQVRWKNLMLTDLSQGDNEEH